MGRDITRMLGDAYLEREILCRIFTHLSWRKPAVWSRSSWILDDAAWNWRFYSSIVEVASRVEIWCVFISSRFRQLKFEFFGFYLFFFVRNSPKSCGFRVCVFFHIFQYVMWSRRSEAAGNVSCYLWRNDVS